MVFASLCLAGDSVKVDGKLPETLSELPLFLKGRPVIQVGVPCEIEDRRGYCSLFDGPYVFGGLLKTQFLAFSNGREITAIYRLTIDERKTEMVEIKLLWRAGGKEV